MTHSPAPPSLDNRWCSPASSSSEMPPARQSPDLQQEAPKEKDFRTPGLRGARTTTLFRAVNPELFIKPNKTVMAFGLVTLTLCVAYIGYLHAQQENKKDLYEAIDSEGNRQMKRKTSKWD
ncbi:small integral membrane protein 8 [Anolis sagrei]|uniref:small integral membrane protein 8 n=1 Tax=Anolis sagrei TaxID=38937 RepID=UPI003521907A